MNSKITELPTLYKDDKNGKRRMWRCWFEDDTIYREYGLVEGKKICSSRTFEPKNVGKKNETSASEQASNNANREWIDHIDDGYAPSEDDKIGLGMVKKLKAEKEETGGHNINAVACQNDNQKSIKNIKRNKEDTCMINNVEPLIPMKASVWELTDESDPFSVAPKVLNHFCKKTGKGKNITYEDAPFYAQPKLDGLRMRVMLVDGNILMASNSGKQFPWFKSLRDCFLKWFKAVKNISALLIDGLDGELYAHNFIDSNGSIIDSVSRFSTITSIGGLSRTNPHELEDQIQFHCFDLMDRSGSLTQEERFDNLDLLFKTMPNDGICNKRIIRVDTRILTDVKEVVNLHNSFVNSGYEGIILRTFNLKYAAGKRPLEIRKFKMFKDEEFEITGCKVDKGVSVDQFVWTFITEDGVEFCAKPEGSTEQKIKWYNARHDYVGKYMTVKYQDKSDTGVPRFPIVKHFRAGKGID
jgi:ATP-dependent DNA ligase